MVTLADARYYAAMKKRLIKLGSNGRLVIPADYRRQLGISDGDALIVRVADGELRIRTLASAIERAQRLVRKYVPKSTSLVQELLEERRGATKYDG